MQSVRPTTGLTAPLWWFAVVCGGLLWFAVMCGGMYFSHTGVDAAGGSSVDAAGGRGGVNKINKSLATAAAREI